MFLNGTCYKVRKSDPSVSIGTCSVHYGRSPAPVVICPARFLERRQVFIDCFHLLTLHEPGNELHIVSEVAIPGGAVDYFLVSAKDGRVKDFVGIELQALDTTGTIWPQRQQLLHELGVLNADAPTPSPKAFGMNWKMTAKTTLVQLHHKVQTFEHVNKKLVLVLQDGLLGYMSREFNFQHVHSPAVLGDSMQIHAYSLVAQPDQTLRLGLAARASTDADGVGACLGLQAEARIELEQILDSLQHKLSAVTLFLPV